MSESAAKTETPVQPSEAIADAVMISYKKMLDKLPPGLKRDDLNEVFRLATQSKCDKASLDVLKTLANKHRGLFRNMLLVTTHDLYGKMRGFDYHTYFLVEDVNGYWSAASPANHALNGDMNYGTTVIRDKNLEGVVRQLSNRDEADFPSAGQIREKLAKFPSVSGNKDSLQFLELDLMAGDVFVDHRPRAKEKSLESDDE